MVNEPMVNEAMVNNSSAFEEISELNQASASEPQLEKDLSKDAQLNSDLLEGRESETEGLFEETDVNITPILYSVPLKLTYNDGTEKLCSLDITSQFNSAQYNQSITVPTFTSVYEPEYFESIQNKILNHNQEFSNLVSVEDMVSHNVININHNLDLVFNNTCPIVNEMAVMDLQKLLAIVCPEFEICSAPNEYSLNSVGECFEMHDDLS